MTWLALKYNLKVKFICLDNEINQIKTRDWCNNIGILFELYALDTHTQNGSAECFAYFIIEKARAIRLSINLQHKL